MDLFEDNIGLVESIVKRMDYGHFEREDLRQAGLMGLFKATTRFIEAMGVSFSTYATTYIIGEIKKEMRESQAIKMNKEMFKIIRYIKKTENASISEIAKALNVRKESILLAFNYQEKIISLNKESQDGELINMITNKENDTIISYDEICSILDVELSNIIQLRYFNGMRQEDVAQLLQINQYKVSRLEKKALMILREVYLK